MYAHLLYLRVNLNFTFVPDLWTYLEGKAALYIFCTCLGGPGADPQYRPSALRGMEI